MTPLSAGCSDVGQGYCHLNFTLTRPGQAETLPELAPLFTNGVISSISPSHGGCLLGSSGLTLTPPPLSAAAPWGHNSVACIFQVTTGASSPSIVLSSSATPFTFPSLAFSGQTIEFRPSNAACADSTMSLGCSGQLSFSLEMVPFTIETTSELDIQSCTITRPSPNLPEYSFALSLPTTSPSNQYVKQFTLSVVGLDRFEQKYSDFPTINPAILQPRSYPVKCTISATKHILSPFFQIKMNDVEVYGNTEIRYSNARVYPSTQCKDPTLPLCALMLFLDSRIFTMLTLQEIQQIAIQHDNFFYSAVSSPSVALCAGIPQSERDTTLSTASAANEEEDGELTMLCFSLRKPFDPVIQSPSHNPLIPSGSYSDRVTFTLSGKLLQGATIGFRASDMYYTKPLQITWDSTQCNDARTPICTGHISSHYQGPKAMITLESIPFSGIVDHIICDSPTSKRFWMSATATQIVIDQSIVEEDEISPLQPTTSCHIAYSLAYGTEYTSESTEKLKIVQYSESTQKSRVYYSDFSDATHLVMPTVTATYTQIPITLDSGDDCGDQDDYQCTVDIIAVFDPTNPFNYLRNFELILPKIDIQQLFSDDDISIEHDGFIPSTKINFSFRRDIDIIKDIAYFAFTIHHQEIDINKAFYSLDNGSVPGQHLYDPIIQDGSESPLYRHRIRIKYRKVPFPTEIAHSYAYLDVTKPILTSYGGFPLVNFSAKNVGPFLPAEPPEIFEFENFNAVMDKLIELQPPAIKSFTMAVKYFPVVVFHWTEPCFDPTTAICVPIIHFRPGGGGSTPDDEIPVDADGFNTETVVHDSHYSAYVWVTAESYDQMVDFGVTFIFPPTSFDRFDHTYTENGIEKTLELVRLGTGRNGSPIFFPLTKPYGFIAKSTLKIVDLTVTYPPGTFRPHALNPTTSSFQVEGLQDDGSMIDNAEDGLDIFSLPFEQLSTYLTSFEMQELQRLFGLSSIQPNSTPQNVTLSTFRQFLARMSSTSGQTHVQATTESPIFAMRRIYSFPASFSFKEDLDYTYGPNCEQEGASLCTVHVSVSTNVFVRAAEPGKEYTVFRHRVPTYISTPKPSFSTPLTTITRLLNDWTLQPGGFFKEVTGDASCTGMTIPFSSYFAYLACPGDGSSVCPPITQVADPQVETTFFAEFSLIDGVSYLSLRGSVTGASALNPGGFYLTPGQPHVPFTCSFVLSKWYNDQPAAKLAVSPVVLQDVPVKYRERIKPISFPKIRYAPVMITPQDDCSDSWKTGKVTCTLILDVYGTTANPVYNFGFISFVHITVHALIQENRYGIFSKPIAPQNQQQYFGKSEHIGWLENSDLEDYLYAELLFETAYTTHTRAYVVFEDAAAGTENSLTKKYPKGNLLIAPFNIPVYKNLFKPYDLATYEERLAQFKRVIRLFRDGEGMKDLVTKRLEEDEDNSSLVFLNGILQTGQVSEKDAAALVLSMPYALFPELIPEQVCFFRVPLIVLGPIFTVSTRAQRYSKPTLVPLKFHFNAVVERFVLYTLFASTLDTSTIPNNTLEQAINAQTTAGQMNDQQYPIPCFSSPPADPFDFSTIPVDETEYHSWLLSVYTGYTQIAENVALADLPLAYTAETTTLTILGWFVPYHLSQHQGGYSSTSQRQPEDWRMHFIPPVDPSLTDQPTSIPINSSCWIYTKINNSFPTQSFNVDHEIDVISTGEVVPIEGPSSTFSLQDQLHYSTSYPYFLPDSSVEAPEAESDASGAAAPTATWSLVPLVFLFAIPLSYLL